MQLWKVRSSWCFLSGCVCVPVSADTHMYRGIFTCMCVWGPETNLCFRHCLPFIFFKTGSSIGTQDLPSRLRLLASKPWRSTNLHFPWLRLQIFCIKLYICSGVQTDILKLVWLTIWNEAFPCPLSDVLSGVSLCYQLGCVSVMPL